MISKTKNMNLTIDNSLKPSYIFSVKVNAKDKVFTSSRVNKLLKGEIGQQVQFEKYQIKETDLRKKTATFTTPHYFDLTKGKTCIVIASPYHENFGGVILNVDYDQKTGLYSYQCQDHSRTWQSKINLRQLGKYSYYQIIQSLLCSYTDKGFNVPKSVLKKHSTILSGLRPLSSYDEKKLGGKLKLNGLATKNQLIMEKTSVIDIIRNLAFAGSGAYIDVYIDEWGIVHLDPVNKDKWLTSGIYITTPELAESKLKFDATNIITGVTVLNENKKKEGKYFDSSSLLGINLSAYFGDLVTTVDNPNNTNTNKSANSNSSNYEAGNGRTVFMNIDNINSPSSDLKVMQDISGYLNKKGYKTEIGGIGPSYHYSQVNRVKRNGIYMCIYGGACAGTLKEHWESSHYKDVMKAKNARQVVAFLPPTYDYIHNLNWLPRAHDDNFSPSGFTGVANPEKHLLDAGIGVVYGKNAKEIADNFPGFKDSSTNSSTSNVSSKTNNGSSTVDVNSASYINKEKKEALEAMTDQIRDLLSVSIKFPVGNLAFKHLHTNMFLWTELPDNLLNKMKLSNFAKIGNAMRGSYTRYSGYSLDRWYVEEVTITNDSSKFEFDVKVNPFPSSLSSYSKAVRDAINTYSQATNVNNSSNSALNSNSTNNVAVPKRTDGATDCSTSMKIACNTSWAPIGEQVNKVESKRAMGKIGREGTNYEKFVRGLTPKQAYKKLASRINYSNYEGYYDNRHNCADETFLKRNHNCGDAARLLKACMDVLDQPCVIYCVPGHYMNGVLINGKWETVDLCYQSGAMPQYQTAGWNR